MAVNEEEKKKIAKILEDGQDIYKDEVARRAKQLDEALD